jgi:hypothetical protein
MQTETVQKLKLQPFSVGQLAKTPCPTLKPNKTKALPLGRHQKKTSRTHARTRIDADFDLTKIKYAEHFKIRKVVKNDFLQTIPLLFDSLENCKVIFHNQDYVNALFETYHKKHALLFLDWVKTFVLIRRAERNQLLENVLQSTEHDFLTAFKLFKLQDVRAKKGKVTLKEKIWAIILKYYPEKPFETKDIYEKTIMENCSVASLLLELKEENKLKRVRKIKAHIRYQVIQNQEK